MSQPISIDILSDDEEPQNDAVSTPFPRQSKRQRKDASSNPEDDNGEPHDAVLTPVRPQSMRQCTEPLSTHTILVIDDDPTPRKPEGSTSAQSFVAETPMADFPNSGVTIVKCSSKSSSDPLKFSGICGLICLESDNDSESGSGNGKWRQTNTPGIACDAIKDSKLRRRLVGSEFFHEECLLAGDNVSRMSRNISSLLISSEDDINQANDTPAEEVDNLEPNEDILKLKSRSKINANKGKDADEGNKRRRKTKEERIQLKEEKNQLREMEKLQKAAMKAEAAELKKLEKEKQKWEKGKFALKSIVAEVDTKVVELGSVGGHLLTRFAEKGVTYRITSNPIERSIVWNMAVPDQISQLSSSNTLDIPYVLVLVEAEEFCNLVNNETLMGHVSYVRSHYPSHTICYLTNRLMAYIHKREQEQYKNPANFTSWKRPPVEEVLSKLTTHFVRVHSRQCIDEAELAEHVVGLSCSLASCQFRKKLTRLSVNANGALIPKDCVDKDLFKKNLWLKALIAIPKVQPRFAIAIWKKYPTMRSLLSVYIDPNKSVHEKEFLLKDLTTEGLLCDDRRLGEVCSKRVYRILTAQCGISKTDDVEDGADFFSRKSI